MRILSRKNKITTIYFWKLGFVYIKKEWNEVKAKYFTLRSAWNVGIVSETHLKISFVNVACKLKLNYFETGLKIYEVWPYC